MPFIGNSGKLDRVFLARLDPQNVEDQGSKQIQNIITGDVEAANLFTSNIAILNNYEPTHNFELGSNLFMDDNPDDVSSIVLDVKSSRVSKASSDVEDRRRKRKSDARVRRRRKQIFHRYRSGFQEPRRREWTHAREFTPGLFRARGGHRRRRRR